MGAIFISHASHDAAKAAEVRERLAAEGFRSVFLDIDERNGIVAGTKWEDELYRKLHTCSAVIALNSKAYSESQWCFAELAQAKMLGKPVFPARIDDSDLLDLIRDRQAVDLSGTGAEAADAYSRLFRGLRDAGIARDNWDGSRPPYPGLFAFAEEDAPVFFGREAVIEAAHERLAAVRNRRTSSWFILVGASGSGKSSLMRAGLLPRLRQEVEQWIVVDAIVPGADPMQRLALAFGQTFARLGQTRDWKELREILRAADDQRLSDLAGDLRAAGRHPEATVLVAIDQLDELLDTSSASEMPPHSAFTACVQRLSELPGRPFLILATLRDGFLGAFQNHRALRRVESEEMVIKPVATDRLRAVIEGPAQRAGITLEEGLVDELVRDTGTEDALPLLAFVLRELYESSAARTALRLSDYHGLGGIENAIARAADRVLSEQGVTGDKLLALRSAFLALVRLGDRRQPVRRAARWDSLPPEALPALLSYVEARLLVTQGEGAEREVRVAHEALFRSWPTLKKWIDEAGELLAWRRRVAPLLESWEESGRDEGSLLRGAALGEAYAWYSREGSLLTNPERDFINASKQFERRNELRERRRNRRVQIGSLSAAALLTLIAAFAGKESLRARAGEQRAKANEDAARISEVRALESATRAKLASLLAYARGNVDPTRAAVALREGRGSVPGIGAMGHALVSQHLFRDIGDGRWDSDEPKEA